MGFAHADEASCPDTYGMELRMRFMIVATIMALGHIALAGPCNDETEDMIQQRVCSTNQRCLDVAMIQDSMSHAKDAKFWRELIETEAERFGCLPYVSIDVAEE